MAISTKTPKEINSQYKQKAKQSFLTRFNLLLYSRIVKKDYGVILEKDLEDFKIEENPDILDEYLHIYWQLNDKEPRKEYQGQSINDIYLKMQEWQKTNKQIVESLQKYYVDNVFPKDVFQEEDFKTFFKGDIHCEYCKIDEDAIINLINAGKIHKKHITRGWSLEIDRKEPNKEYTEENCVWCCYWCNNAKTDEFTYEEFLKIGQTIENVWKKRLIS